MSGKPMKKESEYVDPNAPPEHPGFGIFEVFWRYAPDKDGHYKKLSLSERFERGIKLADYYSDKFKHWLENRQPAPQPNESDMALNLRDGYFTEEQNQAQEQRDVDRSAGRDNEFENKDDDPKVERMNQGPGGVGGSRHGYRIYMNREDTGHMVGSDHIGPERQVPLNRDPWPLGKPDGREAGETVEMITDQRGPLALPPPDAAVEKTTPDQGSIGSDAVPPAKQITDGRAEKDLPPESSDGGATQSAPKSRAEEAADRGREAAVRMAERKAAEASTDRPTPKREAEDEAR